MLRQALSPRKIIAYSDSGQRSIALMQASVQGARHIGINAQMRSVSEFHGKIDADIAVIYGLRAQLKSVLETYAVNKKQCLFIDLGYFGRVDGGKLSGYHRVSVNTLFPTFLFNREIELPTARKQLFNLRPKPARIGGKYILLAGMSAKSAWVNGLAAEQYEREIIVQLKQVSDLPIVYRPKPTWTDARPLPGALYSPPQQDLTDILRDAALVVSHHSNTGIDAILQGVPTLTSVACPPWYLSAKTVEELETFEPPSQDQRDLWLDRVVYSQWSVEEIGNGTMWKFLIKSGQIQI